MESKYYIEQRGKKCTNSWFFMMVNFIHICRYFVDFDQKLVYKVFWTYYFLF